MKQGDRVKMTKAFKETLIQNGCLEHVQEFGDCEGVVICLTDYNDCLPGSPTHDTAKVGPEWDVCWKPTGLRYAYHPDHLVVI